MRTLYIVILVLGVERRRKGGDLSKLFESRQLAIQLALQRNLAWAQKTNEIAMQIRKWTVAYVLLFFGFILKDNANDVTWLHFVLGTCGLAFFMSLDVIQSYFGRILNTHWYKLNDLMNRLPLMPEEELAELAVLPTSPRTIWNRRKKLRVIVEQLLCETSFFFYGGLFLILNGLLVLKKLS